MTSLAQEEIELCEMTLPKDLELAYIYLFTLAQICVSKAQYHADLTIHQMQSSSQTHPCQKL